MTQPSLIDWLKRGRSVKKRKPLKPVSEKRKKENAIYLKKRKAFLKAHPYCMAYSRIVDWMLENDSAELFKAPKFLPLSTEIHHTKKPKCKYLNDEITWLAVSNWSHRFIENNKSVAREIGLLQ